MKYRWICSVIESILGGVKVACHALGREVERMDLTPEEIIRF